MYNVHLIISRALCVAGAIISSAIICIKMNIKFHVIILFLLRMCIQIKLLNGLLIYPAYRSACNQKIKPTNSYFFETNTKEAYNLQ